MFPLAFKIGRLPKRKRHGTPLLYKTFIDERTALYGDPAGGVNAMADMPGMVVSRPDGCRHYPAMDRDGCGEGMVILRRFCPIDTIMPQSPQG
jgi:hypothetical protein